MATNAVSIAVGDCWRLNDGDVRGDGDTDICFGRRRERSAANYIEAKRASQRLRRLHDGGIGRVTERRSQ